MKNPDKDPMDARLLESMLEAVDPIKPPAALRDRILTHVFSRGSERNGARTIRGGEQGWRTLFPGLDYKMLVYDELAGSKSFLLRARAGTRLPAHEHHGYEECLVLEGEFSFEGLHLKAGDFHGVSRDVPHGESWTDTGTLVYLRASILDYPGVDP